MSSIVIDMNYSEIITMGIAVTLGDAIGMGLGDYVSYKS
jgi:VIT1/CCC1 family predicted Fe2+/Mn2+ transporter